MPAIQHTHSYSKSKTRKDWWKCDHPRCTHWASKEAVEGKLSLCPCGREFVMDYDAMLRRRPKCLMCSTSKKAKEFQAVQTLAASILIKDPPKEAEEEDFSI